MNLREHLILYDTSCDEVIGTYRAIFGSEAIRRDGFYGHAEFDLVVAAGTLARVDAGGAAVKQGAQTEIGGNDRYVALCRKHFAEALGW